VIDDPLSDCPALEVPGRGSENPDAPEVHHLRARPRVFLLSPAYCGGKRAKLLLNPKAQFPLAEQLRAQGNAPIGEVFSFVSGLYFRGKLAYARAFARPPRDHPGILVITPTRGMVPPDMPVTLEELAEFAMIDISEHDIRYRGPLTRDAAILASVAQHSDTILLGSVATGKYIDVLQELLSGQLLFPGDFVGRGDMSRGGLMLRCVRERRELQYLSIQGTLLRGQRPPKLNRS
jgi:hypothetical protein